MERASGIGKRKSHFSSVLAGLVAAAFWVALIAEAPMTCAAEPPDKPFLRIELGSHSEAIKAAAADADSRFLVTASVDKTVRIWSLADHRLQRVLRPPIGDDREGVLTSVAISPDGSVVACGGRTGKEWDDRVSVYLFDRETGRMSGTLGGLPGFITSLCFSRDGRFLAATLTKGGVVVFDTRTWQRVGHDRSYNDSVTSADFDRRGRLVAVASDGIRIYKPLGQGEGSLVPEKRADLPVDGTPEQVRFSPDGRFIALGYTTPYRMDIFDAQTAHLAATPYEAPSRQADKDFSVGSIAWSVDGASLYASGSLGHEGKKTVLHWSVSGDGSISPVTPRGLKRGNKKRHEGGIPGVSEVQSPCDAHVNQLVPLADGRLAFVSGDAVIGVIDRDDRLVHADTSTLARYKHITSEFRISREGDRVQFAFEKYGMNRAVFSIFDRTLSKGDEVSEPLAAPLVNPPVPVTGWNYSNEPKLDGVPLNVEGRRARCFAVNPDNSGFLLGADNFVFHFDFTGKMIWRVRMPGAVFGLNISGDRRLFAVALLDGTVRWYTMDRPAELLALFAHPDQNRWVLFTPEGYFDASPGGAELIGYHINQGRQKEARFVPVANLYDIFYRPDIIQTKIRGEDITGLITVTAEEALRFPPPEVRFTAIPQRTADEKATVCYRIRSTGGGVGEVRLFQNGKLIKSDGFYREVARKDAPAKVTITGLNGRAIYQDQRGLKIKERGGAQAAFTRPKGDLVEECIEIDTMAGENDVSVAAFNAANTVQSPLETASFTATRKPEEPHLYILAVGIDTYRDGSISLKYAAKDARDFIARLPEKARSIYRPENIHVTALTNEQAGKRQILTAIRDLAQTVRHGDGFIFFDASHGVLLQNQYYIVTADFAGDLENGDALISSNEIVEMSKNIKALSQLFIFDTCHAGGVDTIVSGLYDARMVNLARKMGLHIFASAGSVQTALDGYRGNGLYTHTLLQGLANGRDVDTGKSGTVTVRELGLYTKDRTTRISTGLGHPQTPFIINFGRDNPLYTVK